MLTLSVLLSLFGVAPTASATASAPSRLEYVILADETRRARLRSILEAGPADQYREASESGMFYVSCVSAWRNNPGEAEACIRSRLPRSAEVPLIVINGYGETRGDRNTMFCVGQGGTGTAELRADPHTEDQAALASCLDEALRSPSDGRPSLFRVASIDQLSIADVVQAKASATKVAVAAIDHVGFPRGMAGDCLVQGRLLRIEKGAWATPGGWIEASVPCGTGRAEDRQRRVHMAEMGPGNFARLYLSDEDVLLHIEPAGP